MGHYSEVILGLLSFDSILKNALWDSRVKITSDLHLTSLGYFILYLKHKRENFTKALVLPA